MIPTLKQTKLIPDGMSLPESYHSSAHGAWPPLGDGPQEDEEESGPLL